MIILNFSHPLTDAHLAEIARMSGSEIEQVIDIPIHFDEGQPFSEQTAQVSAQLPLDSRTLQTAPLLIVMPSLNYITAALLAELNGRMGYFPAILRMRVQPGSLPTVYEIAEIINLQAIRDESRKNR